MIQDGVRVVTLALSSASDDVKSGLVFKTKTRERRRDEVVVAEVSLVSQRGVFFFRRWEKIPDTNSFNPIQNAAKTIVTKCNNCLLTEFFFFFLELYTQCVSYSLSLLDVLSSNYRVKNGV